MAISEIEVSAVTIDGVEVFPALLLPGEWNGYAVPVFSMTTVLAIADFFRASYARPVNGVMTVPAGVAVTFDEVADTFTFATPDDYDGVPEVFDSVTIGGRKFYGIGAGSWTWRELEQEEYAEAVPLFGHVYEALGSLQDFKAEAGI